MGLWEHRVHRVGFLRLHRHLQHGVGIGRDCLLMGSLAAACRRHLMRSRRRKDLAGHPVENVRNPVEVAGSGRALRTLMALVIPFTGPPQRDIDFDGRRGSARVRGSGNRRQRQTGRKQNPLLQGLDLEQVHVGFALQIDRRSATRREVRGGLGLDSFEAKRAPAIFGRVTERVRNYMTSPPLARVFLHKIMSSWNQVRRAFVHPEHLKLS